MFQFLLTSAIVEPPFLGDDFFLYVWGNDPNNFAQLNLTGNWVAIESGTSHSVALRSDGLLYAWGLNNAGQVGDGTSFNRSSPVQIGLSSWTAISAGASHTMAIRADGTLFGWGLNSSGQLGVSGSQSWIQISSGANHTLAINSAGTLFAWGLGTSGQLGDGTAVTKSSPVQIGLSSWTAVAAGVGHSAAIRIDGTLFTWGLNSSGQLGDNTTINKSSPVQIGSSSWSAVSSEGTHTVALLSNKLLFSWGLNSSGQLGDNTTVNKSSPVPIGSASWSSISAGVNHSAAIRLDGILFTWGLNSSGQLGDNGLSNRLAPIQIGNSSWTAISAGGSHTLAIRNDGMLFAWGINTSGQLGYTNSSHSWIALSAAPGDGTGAHTLAIRSDGQLWGWGLNNAGQLGDGTTITKSSPVLISTSSWVMVSAGLSHSTAVRSGGTIFTWGLNSSGQLGDNTTINKSSPVTLASTPLSYNTMSWILVDAGTQNTAAIRSDGLLFTWGLGTTGQLGIMTDIYSWTQVSAGVTHAAAIRSDGLLFSWGLNSSGQLGDGTTVNKSSPVQIGSSSWTAVDSGNGFTSAIRGDGLLFTWGLNSSGQLGDGTITNKSSPVQIGSSSWTAIHAGGSHMIAIRTDGSLFSWGLNSSGQLGDGTTVNKSNPVAINLPINNLRNSVYFDGTGDYLTVNSNAIIPSTGDFTIETWVYPTLLKTSTIVYMAGSGATTDFVFYYNTSGALGVETGSVFRETAIGLIVINNWRHVALTKTGSTYRIFVNGTERTFTGTALSSTLTISTLNIGGLGATNNLQGYLSSLRITQNIVYNADFTVSTSPLVAISGTSLLTCQSNRFVDTSGNRLNIINRFTETSISSFSPFVVSNNISVNAIWAGSAHNVALSANSKVYTWGLNNAGQLGDNSTINALAPLQIAVPFFDITNYSVLFDGNGDYLTIANNATFNFNADPFTIEMWFYLTGNANLNNDSVRNASLFCAFPSSGTANYANSYDLVIYGNNTTTGTGIGFIKREAAVLQQVAYSGTILQNTWYHVAVVRSSSTTLTLYLNGQQVAQLTSLSGNVITGGWPIYVAQLGFAGYLNQFPGYISNLRVVNGTALYTSNFTPPIEKLSSVPNTILLTCQSNGFIDNSSSNFVITQAGNTSISNFVPFDLYLDSVNASYVTAGASHTAMISTESKLYTWGLGTSGQLGDGTAISKSRPAQIGSSSWTAVSAGQNHTLAKSNDLVFAWGLNSSFQLGDGSTINRSSPVLCVLLDTLSVFSGGDINSYGIQANLLYAWGAGTVGAIGDNTTINKSISVLIGDNPLPGNQSTPAQVGSKLYTTVSMGGSHTAAIRSDGILFTWGAGTNGQLGIVTTNYSWIQINSGASHTVAIRSDGRLFTWGLNSSGQLGDATTVNKSSPIQIGIKTWTKVAAGNFHSLAIRSDGKLFSWGLGTSGELGDGTSISKSIPVQIGSDSFISITGGGNHSLAVRYDRILFAWGLNSSGQLGDNTYVNKSSPVQIGSSSWTIVSAGGTHTVGIDSSNVMYVWGRNFEGQLGTVLPSSWTVTSSGQNHTLAIQNDGMLFAWGLGTSGQLGDGTVVTKSSPVQIGSSSWTAVAAGNGFSMAIRSDGKLFTWGLNSSGELGDGTLVSKSSPVQIGTRSWTAISTDFNHSLALRSDGYLYAWGLNSSYQIGDSTSSNRSSPSLVGMSRDADISIYLDGNAGNYITSQSSVLDTKLLTFVIEGWIYPINVASSRYIIGEMSATTSLNYWSVNLTTSSQLNFYWYAGAGYNCTSVNTVTLGAWNYITISVDNGAITMVINGINTATTGTNTLGSRSANTTITIGQYNGGNNFYGYLSNLRVSSDTSFGYVPPYSLSVTPYTLFFVLKNPYFIENAKNKLLTVTGTVPTTEIIPFSNSTLASSFSSISAGNSHNTAISVDGKLFAWGRGTEGQLGYLPQIYSWTQLSSGFHHNLAIRSDGMLFSWGENAYGALGDQTNTNKSSPVQIGSSSWTAVSAGTYHSLAIRSGGTLFAWGLGSSGQLGTGVFTQTNNSPLQVGTKSWTAVNASHNYSLGITSDNVLYAWGHNHRGIFGTDDANLFYRPAPAPVGMNSTSIASVRFYQAHGSYLRVAQSAKFDFGTNTFCIEGWFYTNNYSYYTGWVNFFGIGAYGGYSSKLNVYDSDGSGILRVDINGTVVMSTFESQKSTLIDKWAHIALVRTGTGSNQTTLYVNGISKASGTVNQGLFFKGSNFIIGSNGELYSNNLNGYVSNFRVTSGSPVYTNNFTVPSAALTSSANTVLLTCQSESLKDNGPNSLGIETINHAHVDNFTPFTGTITYNTFKQVAAGNYHVLGINTNGLLYSWGYGYYGQLGIATPTTQYSWRSVAAGGEHTVAIRSDYKLFTWGRNTEGQLGNGKTSNTSLTSSPVQIGTNSWVAVAAGLYHSLGIKADNTLWAWGYNNSGQLGTKQTTNYPIPQQIGLEGLTQPSWSTVAAGAYHSAALTGNVLYTWGLNNYGQLGDNTTQNRSIPVIVGVQPTTAASVYFDGSTMLSTPEFVSDWPNNLNLATSTINFQIEAWIYITEGDYYRGIISHRNDDADGWCLYVHQDMTVYLGAKIVGQSYMDFQLSTTKIQSGVWTHLCLTKTAYGYYKLYINGVNTQTLQYFDGLDFQQNKYFQIGAVSSSMVWPFRGYISGVKIQKGGTVRTANFTPSTAPVTSDANTVFIACNSETLKETLTNKSLTRANLTPPIVSVFAPYVANINVTGITKISLGHSHTTALSTNSMLLSWGRVNEGQTGVLSNLPPRYIDISGAEVHRWAIVASMVATYSTTYAIRTDGLLFAWGHNTYGQIGDGTTIEKSSPVQIGTDSWVAISAGNAGAAIAIRADGRLFAWGRGNFGGGATALVSDTKSWKQVSAGDGLVIAIRSDGLLFTWGTSITTYPSIYKNAVTSSPNQIGYSSWTMVSGGGTHVAAIRADGSLFTWGNNTYGQLGNNTTVTASSPVAIGGESWVWVSAANFGGVTAAIRHDGKLFTWGRNNTGQLGDGTTVNKSSPVQVGSSNWTMVDVNINHSVAIRSDGIVFCWGTGGDGRLGDGTAVSKSSPVQIAGIAANSSFSVVSAGTNNTYGIAGGKLFAWGTGTNGQLGDGTAVSKSSPIQIGSFTDWYNVRGSNWFALAVRTNGALYSWGYNLYGQLGDGTNVTKSSPVQIGLDGQWWTSDYGGLGPGYTHSSMIRADGTLYSVGASNTGIYGGATGSGSSPVLLGNILYTSTATWKYEPFPIGTDTWKAVASGATHTMAIRSDGRLFTWGFNQSGQLGDGTTVSKTTMTQIGNDEWVSIAAGAAHSLAIKKGVAPNPDWYGTLWAWGLNDVGQLGIGLSGTVNNRNSPVQVGSSIWAMISAGQSHSVGVKDGLSFYGWGLNNFGQLADSTNTNRSSPVIGGSLELVGQLKAGASHTAFLGANGTLYTWGLNSSGQLGNGTAVNSNFPGSIKSALGWGREDNAATGGANPSNYKHDRLQLACGPNSTFVIDNNGQFIWSMGNNSSGQLGDGTTINKSSPIAVASLYIPDTKPQVIGTSSWTAIASGSTHTAGIRSDGYLFTWGGNDYGQLGDSTTINKSSPVQIGSSSWTAVAAGEFMTMAIRSGGTLFAWGRGTEGQIGDGIASTRSSPVQVGSASWIAITAGEGGYYAAGIASNNYLYTWGYNNVGQLGLINITNYSSPVQIGGQYDTEDKLTPVQISSSSWTLVAAGEYHNLAIRQDYKLYAWGRNNFGQLGDGTITDRSSPVQIGSADWVKIEVGESHSLGLVFPSSNVQEYTTPGTYQWVCPAGVTSVNAVCVGGGGRGQGVGEYVFGSGGGGGLGWKNNIPVVPGNTYTVQVGAGGGTTAVANGGDSWFVNSSTVRGGGGSAGTQANGYTAPGGTYTGDGGGNGGAGRGTRENYWQTGGGGGAGGYAGNGGEGAYGGPERAGTDAPAGGGGGGGGGGSANNPYTGSGGGGGGVGLFGQGTSGVGGAANGTYSLDGYRGAGGSGAPGSGGTSTRGRDGGLYGGGGAGPSGLGGGGAVRLVYAAGTSFPSNAPFIKPVYAAYAWGRASEGQLGNLSLTGRSSPVQIGSALYGEISGGRYHAGALREDSSIQVWGYNFYGTVGDNTTVAKSSPVTLGGVAITDTQSIPVQINSSSWIAVAAGGTHTVAIRSGGTLWAWGLNSSGQLGDGTTTNRSSPVPIGSAVWTSISAGYTHTLGITGNILYAWGYNLRSQLGDGTTINRSSPVQISSSSWTAVSAGSEHSGAIDSNNILFTWGYNVNGQLGDYTTVNRSSPNMVQAPFINRPITLNTALFSTASAGGAHTLAITTVGYLFAWGLNTSGQVGDGTTINRYSPVQLGVNSWIAVAAGASFSMALRSNNKLFTWGANNLGQLAASTTVARSSPVSVGTLTWSSIAAEGDHGIGIASDNSLYAWGLNNSGQIGDVSTVNKSSFSQIGNITLLLTQSSPVQIGTRIWSSVSAGGFHTLALTTNGTLFTWGLNSGGQLGDLTTIDKGSPIQLGSDSWTFISAGISNSAAIRNDGRLFLWGLNNNGALGDNTAINRSSPIIIGAAAYSLENTYWTRVSLGRDHSVGITTEFGAFVWGLNNTGQLGDATSVNKSIPVAAIYSGITATQSSPVQIGTSSWSAISAGPTHSMAISSTGKLFTWGLNSSGQAGENSTLVRYLPYRLGTGNWSKVSAGDAHSIAIDSNASVYAWGLGTSGQIGDGSLVSKSSPVILLTGDIINRSSPTQIGKRFWSAVSAGSAHTLAITSDKLLFAWGLNSSGQLGDGTAVNKSQPQQIGYNSWNAVSAGDSHSIALDISNKLYSWGLGTSGQLGDGTAVTKSSPVQIGSSSWTVISAGGAHTAAIQSDGTMFAWGLNASGQLGDNTVTSRSSPVSLGTSLWRTVSAGASHTVALTANTAMYSWGLNNTYQLGTGTTVNRSAPVLISSANNSILWNTVNAGTGHSLAISNKNQIWVWGTDNAGQLGDIT